MDLGQGWLGGAATHPWNFYFVALLVFPVKRFSIRFQLSYCNILGTYPIDSDQTPGYQPVSHSSLKNPGYTPALFDSPSSRYKSHQWTYMPGWWTDKFEVKSGWVFTRRGFDFVKQQKSENRWVKQNKHSLFENGLGILYSYNQFSHWMDLLLFFSI